MSLTADDAQRRSGMFWPWALRALAAGVLIGLAALIWFWPEISAWAIEQRRLLQTDLARAVNAIRGGDWAAAAALISASALYGFMHAVGPGHGKILIAGAAVASRRTAWRMAGIGVLASLAQALTAILVVYGVLGALALGGSAALGVAEGLLAPLSAGAIALVGLWMVVRGLRLWRADHGHHHDHDDSAGHSCHAGCRHGPTAAETEMLTTWRDVGALIASIGARPCSGALIVLVICWRFELYAVGALSAVAMALGTSLVVSGAAIAATTLRDAGALTDGGDPSTTRRRVALLHIAAGSLVAILSLATLAALIGDPSTAGLIR